MAKKIPVIIVEDHNEVLYHIYRAIGSKKIPFNGLKLLHFDSHPDLGLPDVECSLMKQDYQFLQSLSIENWIMPAVYAEHIDHVIWMKPKWSTQLNHRKATTFSIGEEVSTNRLCVNIPDSYFVEDGVYGSESDMVKPVHFSLSVCDIHEAHTACKDCSDIVFSLLNKPFIADIDLDAFSTQDPFKDRFTMYQRDLIAELYGMPNDEATQTSYSDEETARRISLNRREQLKRLGEWIDIIKNNRQLPDCEEATKLLDLCLSVKAAKNSNHLSSRSSSKLSTSQQTFVMDSGDLPESEDEDNEDVEEVTKQQRVQSTAGATVGTTKDNKDANNEDNNENSLDYLHYLWSGMDSSCNSLPHHVNSESAIKIMIGDVESILNRLHNPLLLTISRSSLDGYTPSHQVAFIQSEVEAMLTRVYGDKILNYDLAYLKSQEQKNNAVGRPSSPPTIKHSTKERKPIKGRRGIL